MVPEKNHQKIAVLTSEYFVMYFFVLINFNVCAGE
jgi:hypothetical protein